MNKLILEPKHETQLNEVKKILSEKGIAFQSEEDYEFKKRMEARKKLVKLAESLPKYDISEEEIQSIAEEVRHEKYGRKKKKNNH